MDLIGGGFADPASADGAIEDTSPADLTLALGRFPWSLSQVDSAVAAPERLLEVRDQARRIDVRQAARREVRARRPHLVRPHLVHLVCLRRRVHPARVAFLALDPKGRVGAACSKRTSFPYAVGRKGKVELLEAKEVGME